MAAASGARLALPSVAMGPVLTIARLTAKEALRRKLLLALLIITFLVISLTAWGVNRLTTVTDGSGQPITPIELKLVVSQLLIVIMFMFAFVLAISTVFVASPAISSDLESGIALAVLTRPISRAEYVLGKWLGLSALAAVYAGGAALIEILVVNLEVGYLPPNTLVFLLYLVGHVVILLTLALLVSTRLSGMTAGVVTLGVFGLAWFGGIAAGIGEAFNNPGITTVGYVSKLILPTDAFWRGAVYSLQPAAEIALYRSSGTSGRAASANPFFAAAPPTDQFLLWTAVWVVAILALTIYSLRRREI
ncbi:MAG TPA: ABC transporter permease subunit [Candidatus Dormibacteraeota bacterium]|nr:ABC transporter permease subunit [Candidatus Dormibacteraeota bacterium]